MKSFHVTENSGERKSIASPSPIVVSTETLKSEIENPTWTVEVASNETFKGFLLRHQPGEGNRLHYHTEKTECWVLLEGDWEVNIEGQPAQFLSSPQVIVLPPQFKHQIRCVGTKPGIRYAFISPQADHPYADTSEK